MPVLALLLVAGALRLLGLHPRRAAVAATPASLNGEVLSNNGAVTYTNTVSWNGGSGGTWSFTSTRSATGPYPGTYTESGSAAIPESAAEPPSIRRRPSRAAATCAQ